MIDQIAPPAAPLAPPAAPPAAPQIKTVYQTDADGLFVGTAAADPCPLGSGVWLIPAGCVEITPPEFGAGQFARWTGEAWAVEDIPAPPEPEPAPPPTLQEARATAVAAMARWIDGFLAQFVAGVPAPELASWPVKADRARQH